MKLANPFFLVFFAAIFFLLLGLSSCKTTKDGGISGGQKTPDPGQPGADSKIDCICALYYDPVCGSDGKTYSNDCFARCAGIKDWTKGACS